MTENKITIRFAEVTDAPYLAAIYKPYVENTAVSFEYEAPDADEFHKRIENTKRTYPYLVAEKDGVIVGYAYASRFRARSAYETTVEVSIYVKESERKRGIGTALYSALEKLLTMQHVNTMVASIADCDREDSHLTKGSIYFHQKAGFSHCGIIKQCGCKFGNSYDLCIMQKLIGEKNSLANKLININDICKPDNFD